MTPLSNVAVEREPLAHKQYTVNGMPDHFYNDLRAARDYSTDIRQVNGPRIAAFAGILKHAKTALHSLDPSLPEEVLFDSLYQSHEVRAELWDCHATREWRHADLELIRADKQRSLRALGTKAVKEKVTSPFELDLVPFHYQGEDGERCSAEMLCASTCVRMVREAITGEKVSEADMYSGLVVVHNNVVIEDNALLSLFALPEFQERHSIASRVVTITGASLNAIATIASRYREQSPEGSAIYGILPIESEVRKHVWHWNVLQAAEDTHVTVHDPKHAAPVANREIPRLDFERRWAQALGRIHLIMTRPSTSSES